MKINKILSLVFALVIFLFPSNALACACCANPGEYSISVRKPSSDELDILKEIRFETANLFTTAAYPDNIKGISSLGDNYTVSAMFQKPAWKLELKDNAGKTGTLSLPLPSSMVAFMADIQPAETDGGNGPTLYKEWRFKSKIGSGTGIFQKGIVPQTEYFLVLQGRGNVCANAEDFTHWRLEVTGRKANYAFYGRVKTRSETAD